MTLLIQIILMGVIATAVIDVWAFVTNILFKFPKTNWAMVGRWLGHLPAGKLTHVAIQETPGVKHELALGWLFHYLIGIAYAAIYLLLLTFFFETKPTLFSATLFGLVTVAAPWFILQPGLGMGFCAAKTPKPNFTRMLNLIVHSIFGVALFLAWMWLQ